MCTLLLLRRPGARWPLLLVANRDEREGRPWLPPGRHWPQQPGVVAGLDQLAGGSWLGINDQGVVAAVTNRAGTLGPSVDCKSRGDLVLQALHHPDAAGAAAALRQLPPTDYRPFNLVLADSREAHWIAHRSPDAGLECTALPVGLTMLTDRDINAEDSPRIRHYRPLFIAAENPDPGREEGWQAWQRLLASRSGATQDQPRTAMTVADGDFATLSSSLIALPATGRGGAVWLFAPGPPDRTAYQDIRLD